MDLLLYVAFVFAFLYGWILLVRFLILRERPFFLLRGESKRMVDELTDWMKRRDDKA